LEITINILDKNVNDYYDQNLSKEKDGIILVIRYLSENRDKIWRYEDETYEVENCPESIAEYLDTDKEDEVGFLPCEGGFRKMDSELKNNIRLL
jgi:hypothetical protein